jgi:hypothetical protein
MTINDSGVPAQSQVDERTSSRLSPRGPQRAEQSVRWGRANPHDDEKTSVASSCKTPQISVPCASGKLDVPRRPMYLSVGDEPASDVQGSPPTDQPIIAPAIGGFWGVRERGNAAMHGRWLQDNPSRSQLGLARGGMPLPCRPCDWCPTEWTRDHSVLVITASCCACSCRIQTLVRSAECNSVRGTGTLGF